MLSAVDAFGTNPQACLLRCTKLHDVWFLHAGMSSCAVQMSLRCAEVAPGAKPRVEGDDGADWCVVDAGKLLDFLLIKLSCIAVMQPQAILHIAQSDVACKEADMVAVAFSMTLPSHAACITTLGHCVHKHCYSAKTDFAVHDGGMQAA